MMTLKEDILNENNAISSRKFHVLFLLCVGKDPK